MKLEYAKIIHGNDGQTTIVTETGQQTVVPNEGIMVTLNKVGSEGWEVISGGPYAGPGGGVTYLLKKEKKADGGAEGLIKHYENLAKE